MSSSLNSLNPLLRQRWSPRAFADGDVSPSTLALLLEAARWAPSCYNDQPWYFLVTRRGRLGYQNLLECLVPQNQAWAATAPVLVLAVARPSFAHNAMPNRHAWYDLGLAAAQLIVQATTLGLAVHQMAGFDAERARQCCAVPAELEPAVVLAIGYQGDPDRLPEGVVEKDPALRERKAIAEFAFDGRWGLPFTGA